MIGSNMLQVVAPLFILPALAERDIWVLVPVSIAAGAASLLRMVDLEGGKASGFIPVLRR